MNKININSLIYKIYLFIFVISVFFLKWYNNSQFIKIASPILLVITLILNKKIKYSKAERNVYLLFGVYLVFNLFFTHNHHHFFNEIYMYILSTFSILIIFRYIKNMLNKNEKVFTFLFYFFNIFNIINFFIMLFQRNYSYFMMHIYNQNLLYGDQITGFIGVNGTHRLTLFYIALIFLNLYNIKYNKKNKNASYFFIIFTLISSLYISSFNDNRAYYFALIISFIPIMIDLLKKLKYKNMIKTIAFSVFLISSILFFYKYNSTFKTFIDNEIIERNFKRTNDNFSSDNIQEERILLFKYALENGNGYALGKGIGAVRIISDETMPKHFGISEITSRVYNGGIVYVALLVLIFLQYVVEYMNIGKKKFYILYITLFITFLAAYQQIFSSAEETILCCFMYYYMGKYIMGDVYEEKKIYSDNITL